MREGRRESRRSKSATSRTKPASIAKEIRYRRSPNLVIYWKNGAFMVEDYLSQARISAAPAIFPVLQFFDRWRSAPALIHHLPGYTPSSLRRTLAALVEHSLLQRSDLPVDP